VAGLLPFNVVWVSTQVNCPPVAVAPGAVKSGVTTAVVEPVQPLTGLVITTVYVPGDETDVVAALPPFDHA
jgi:hypothetical protein